MTAKEFKIWLTTMLLDLAFYVCPDGKFKKMFAIFLIVNLKNLKL
jgi:hypothetical protein